MRAVHLLSGTALVMVLAGCSSGTTEAKPRASLSTQTARTGCYDEDDDLAQVTGDSGTHLALFYGGTLDLAPGTTGRGSEDYDLVGQVTRRFG
jgi:hypothetical protein